MEYLVGTMIELPRAALMADEIAKDAEFFSFGTNDLTQTTFGFSRDDVGKILTAYLSRGHPEAGSFCSARSRGCRRVAEDCRRERPGEARPTIKIGICGEHGGEPSSVEFCASAWASTTCRAHPSAC